MTTTVWHNLVRPDGSRIRIPGSEEEVKRMSARQMAKIVGESGDGYAIERVTETAVRSSFPATFTLPEIEADPSLKPEPVPEPTGWIITSTAVENSPSVKAPSAVSHPNIIGA